MSTADIRKKLHQYIDESEEKKIHAIYTLLEDEITNGSRISIEQYNKEIEEAEAEIDRGEYITHEELKKQIKQW
jgi:predicted transcriptional regulator